MEFKLTRVAGLRSVNRHVKIVHDYGEYSLSWDDISHLWGARICTGEREESPAVIFSTKDMSDLFYIDGTRVPPSGFYFDESGGMPGFTGKKSEALEKKFVWILGQISSRACNASVDRPVRECLKKGTACLPLFDSFGDAGRHCSEMSGASGRSASPGADAAETIDEELRKASRPATERKEWSPGDIIESTYTVHELFKGGMGIVYIVFDSETIGFYALKTFQEQFLWNDSVIGQFVKEAEIWINLERHPHIVQARRVLLIDGMPYILLEYVQGSDLEKMLEKGPLTLGEILRLSIQFCDGMSYAYEKLGLIHRDIKPANCLVTREGILKITDFGLGKIFHDREGAQQSQSAAALPSGETSLSSTSSSSMAGTLPFMAPELFSDTKGAGVSTDIYAFGVVLFMMLTGGNPFFSEDPGEVICNHLTLVPELPDQVRSEIPAELEKVILTCLEKEAISRFGSFSEIRKALADIYLDFYGVDYELQYREDVLSEEDWIHKGMSLASLSRHSSAILNYEQALRLNSRSTGALICRAASLTELSRHEEALADLNEALAVDAGLWDAWYQAGEALTKLGHFDRALASYERAMQLEPDRAEIYWSTGRVHAAMKNHSHALKSYDRAIELKPRMGGVLLDRGKALLALDLLDEASECLQRAIECEPRNRAAWHLRGIVLQRLGYFDDAIETFKKALSLSPDSLEIQAALGDCNREAGHFREARSVLDGALKKKREPVLLLAKAALLGETGFEEKALRLYAEAWGDDDCRRRATVLAARLLTKCSYFPRARQAVDFLISEGDTDDEISTLRDALQFWMGEQEALMKSIEDIRPDAGKDEAASLNSILCHTCDTDNAYALIVQSVSRRQSAALMLIKAQLERAIGLDNEAGISASQAVKLGCNLQQAEELLGLSGGDTGKKGGISIGSLFKKSMARKLSPEGSLIEGLRAMKKGGHIEALSYFSECLTNDPGLHAAWFFAALANVAIGKKEKAEVMLQKFRAAVPVSPGYSRYRVLTAPPSLDQRDMEALYIQWIGADPCSADSWLSYMFYLASLCSWVRLRAVASAMENACGGRISLSRKESRYWNIRGFVSLFLERMEKAAAFFAKGLALAPSDPLSVLGSALCSEKRGETEKARERYQELSGMKGGSLTGLYRLSRLHSRSGNFQEALQASEKAISEKKDSTALNAAKAGILLDSREHGQFSHFYTAIYHLDVYSYPLCLLKTRLHLDEGKKDEAVACMKSGYAARPDHPLFSRSLAYLYLYAGEYEKAQGVLMSMREKHSFSFDYFFCRALCLYRQGDFDEAIAFFRNSRLIAPFEADLLTCLAITRHAMQDMDRAHAHFRTAADLAHRTPRVWCNLGIHLYQRALYRQALQYIERALRIDESHSPSWLSRGAVEKALGNPGDAYLSFEKALQTSPRSLYGWVQKGLIEQGAGEHRTCLESFRRASGIDDSQAWLWYDRGVAALNAEELSEALKSFRSALSLNPGHSGTLLALAVIHAQQGDRLSMNDDLMRLKEADPPFHGRWAPLVEGDELGFDDLILEDRLSLAFDVPLLYGFEEFDPISIFQLMRLDDNF